MSIKILQLNILAPLWVGDMYKQFPCYNDITSPKRITKTLRYLMSYNVDVYVLCEVEQVLVDQIVEYFGTGYSVVFTSNKKGFWSEYLDGKKWIENGTCIIVRSGHILKHSSLDLTGGCMATSVDLLFNDVNITVLSIHLSTSPRKYFEADRLLELVSKIKGVCIVSGDFNMISVVEFEHAGFVSQLLSEEHTTVLLEGVIDHTIVRGAQHIHSKVLRPMFDSKCSVTEGIAHRLCYNPSGSDHYATLSKVTL